MVRLPVFWLFSLLCIASCGITASNSLSTENGGIESLPRGTWVRYPYAVRTEDTMSLEVCIPDGVTTGIPGVIFVHGGAFITGSMDTGPHVSLLDTLVAHGIPCVRISYRLSMADRGFGCDIPASEKQAAVMLASDDLAAAHQWLAESRLPLPEQWIAMGSSAGAETVMWSGYGSAPLPWAGIVSFSGAIVDSITPFSNAPPYFGVHGTCDKVVPPDHAIHRGCNPAESDVWMLCGGLCWGARLQDEGGNAHIHAFCGGMHGVCNSAMLDGHLQQDLIQWITRPEVRLSSGVRYRMEDGTMLAGPDQSCPSPCQ